MVEMTSLGRHGGQNTFIMSDARHKLDYRPRETFLETPAIGGYLAWTALGNI
jgi:hypothetical protein